MLIGLLSGTGSVPVRSAEAEPRRPNILLIFVDDLGYGELGCQGNREIPTPNIDSIAKHGIRFTQGYVTASYCSPSRAGLLTGRYQTRFGYEHNPVGRKNLDPKVGLPLSETTLAEPLRKAGYATGLVGKWHLGGTEKFHPLNQGFDEYFGFLHEGHFFVPSLDEGVTSFLRTNSLPDGLSQWRKGPVIWSTHMGRNEPPYNENNPILKDMSRVNEAEYLTDAWTREAVSFIERNRDRPFFLYLAHNAVHSPMQGADRYMRKFGGIEDMHRRVFAAMLANLDDGVGDVLQSLRKHRLEENTLVFFISDNGGPTRELTSSNAPLRGGKGDYYEGGVRVPFLVQWRGTLPEGVTYDRPAIALDVFPTACAAARVPIRPERRLDGVNLLPFLKGEKAERPHAALFWRAGNKAALRMNDWKLVRHPGRGQGEAAFELYDLGSDISETTDLAREKPELLRKMIAAWSEISSGMEESRW